MCSIQDQQKQFILAGKQDGSLNILKLIQGSEDSRCANELRLVQMYPGLASGTHDAVRSISEPIRVVANNAVDGTWFELSVVSEMRWRTWRIKITKVDGELSKRNRMTWPSVRDSLDFPSFPIQTQSVSSIVLLPKSSELSKVVAKVLADSAPGHSPRYPVSMTIAANRLQVVGLLTKSAVESGEPFAKTERELYEHVESEDEVQKSELRVEETQEEETVLEERQHHPSEPTTIQDRYKLPPMDWKPRTSAASVKDDWSLRENVQKGVSTSKLSRVDYNERVTSVMQRVAQVSDVMNSKKLIADESQEKRSNLLYAVNNQQTMEKSYLQTQAEMARFGPGTSRDNWGGYVRRSYKKRYYTNQSGVKDSLTHDEEGGIMPQSFRRTSAGIPFQSAVYQVGPGSNVSANDWKTSYASQTSMEATPKETFVLGTRQNAQHKHHVTPMYERGQQSSARSQSPSSPWSSRQGSPSLSGSGSSGSLSGRRIDSRRSLLAGIGKLVAAEDLNGLHPPPERHLPESYTSAASKTLLAENYHGTTVGYTGHRNKF
ncbi:hypothetical protein PInf_014217 [Phytophthora infestans]|nr:hypothetical protein PInf_014217 [Phytophthora infestans]